MATSSITCTFFTMPNSSNIKSKVWLHPVDACSNYAIAKIKSRAQPALGHEIRVPNKLQHDSDNFTSTLGRMVKSGLVFHKNIGVRSFEIDPEYRMSTKAILNYLQETSLDHAKKLGLPVDARFGITPAMCKLDLVWVFRDMRLEVDRHPCWGDVVQITNWACTTATGLRFDWTINDTKTGETLVRASCLAVMMNKKTRKTCKLPEEVKDELKAFVATDVDPIVQAQRYPIPRIETMDHIKTGLTPGWNDLDVNYHVNNAKYLDWILESTPDWVIYGHELWKINFEYRKECLKDDAIQSLSRVVTHETDGLELEHVLRLDSGIQVLRARTAWRPNKAKARARANNNFNGSLDK